MSREIKFPSLEEINIQVGEILDKGMKPKKGILSFVGCGIRDIGFRNIFRDKWELLIIAVSMYIVLKFLGIRMVVEVNVIGSNNIVYGYIFLVSPLIFIGCSLFSFINTSLHKTYEIEVSCKYNLYSLASIRMFMFSILGILVNSSLIWRMYRIENNFDFLRGLIVSVTGLFLFSTIFIVGIVYFKKRLYRLLVIGVWILGNAGLIIMKNSIYLDFLMGTSIVIHIAITFICVGVYLIALRKLIHARSNRGEEYVISK